MSVFSLDLLRNQPRDDQLKFILFIYTSLYIITHVVFHFISLSESLAVSLIFCELLCDNPNAILIFYP